jgi:hypothetical protein
MPLADIRAAFRRSVCHHPNTCASQTEFNSTMRHGARAAIPEEADNGRNERIHQSPKKSNRKSRIIVDEPDSEEEVQSECAGEESEGLEYARHGENDCENDDEDASHDEGEEVAIALEIPQYSPIQMTNKCVGCCLQH